MKKTLIVLMMILSIVGFSTSVFAQQPNNTKITVDLTTLDSYTRNAVIDQMKKNDVTGTFNLKDINPTDIKAWVTAVSEGIKDVCHNLNIEVNDFIKTPAGLIVTGSIVYKVIGKDLLIGFKDAFFGIVGWIISMAILYFLARKFVIPRKINVTKEYMATVNGKQTSIKEKTYQFVAPYELNDGLNRVFAFAIFIVLTIAFTIIAMCFVF
jgi:hypothetical protein